jgi:hypothetical protein
MRSVDKDLQKFNWNHLKKEEYLKKCYSYVGDRFGMVKHCWIYLPWRNFFYRNMWKMKGKGLPCHVYTFFFNRCLQKKFSKKDIKIIFAADRAKNIVVHFYTKVKLDGKWLNADVWGKRRGLPFGKNIHDSKWKR